MTVHDQILAGLREAEAERADALDRELRRIGAYSIEAADRMRAEIETLRHKLRCAALEIDALRREVRERDAIIAAGATDLST